MGLDRGVRSGRLYDIELGLSTSCLHTFSGNTRLPFRQRVAGFALCASSTGCLRAVRCIDLRSPRGLPELHLNLLLFLPLLRCAARVEITTKPVLSFVHRCGFDLFNLCFR